MQRCLVVDEVVLLSGFIDEDAGVVDKLVRLEGHGAP